jgi:hypothetical protein
MKNLPDDELFNTLEKRLRNYGEQPDDEVWRKIESALSPTREPGWIVWTNRLAAIFSLTAILFLLNDESTRKESLSDLPASVDNSVNKSDPTRSGILPDRSRKTETNFDKKISLKKREKRGRSNHQASEHVNAVQPTFMENPAVALDLENMARPIDAKVDRWNMALDSPGTEIVQKIKEDSIALVVPQESPLQKRRKKSSLMFYAIFTPSLSFQRVSPVSNDAVVIEKINSPNVFSSERLGISIEAGIQGKITKRLQYMAGVSYYQQNQKMRYEQISEDDVIIEPGDDMDYTVRPRTTEYSFDYRMRNIGIQAGLLYTLKQRGLIHKAGIVLHYQHGLQKSTENEIYNNATSNYLNYQLLYRIEYTFSSKINLFVQPSYMHSIVANESLQAPFRVKQSRAGIGIGLVYRF